jgi:hypothetical protein
MFVSLCLLRWAASTSLFPWESAAVVSVRASDWPGSGLKRSQWQPKLLLLRFLHALSLTWPPWKLLGAWLKKAAFFAQSWGSAHL